MYSEFIIISKTWSDNMSDQTKFWSKFRTLIIYWITNSFIKDTIYTITYLYNNLYVMWFSLVNTRDLLLNYTDAHVL